MKTMALLTLMLAFAFALHADANTQMGDEKPGTPAGTAADVDALKKAQDAPRELRADARTARDRAALMAHLDGWPAEARSAAAAIFAREGPPDEVTGSAVVWRNAGPFARIKVKKEPLQHNFPLPHNDVVEHVVAYRVPTEMVDELAELNGSIVIDRTAGTLAAHCASEQMNLIALNLADDVVRERLKPADARRKMAEAALDHVEGSPVAIAQRLYFKPSTPSAAADTDAPVRRAMGR